MNNSHIIAKLVASQVSRDLKPSQCARIVFQVKPAKKWQRGRFDEIACTFVLPNVTARNPDNVLVDIHVVSSTGGVADVPGTWHIAQSRGGYEFLVKLLLNRSVFDFRGSDPLVFDDRPDQPTAL